MQFRKRLRPQQFLEAALFLRRFLVKTPFIFRNFFQVTWTSWKYMVYFSGSSSTWTIWKDHSLVWKWCFLTTSCQPVLKKTKSEKMFPCQVCSRRNHQIPKTHGRCNRPFPSCPSVCFKVRLSAKPLIWIYFFHSLALTKHIFTRKVLRLASFF